MRLLFNNNLSHRLIAELADIYPNSLHVRDIGPEDAADTDIWDYAREHGLVIVTQDRDYREMSRVCGQPSKLVFITLRNCPTARVAALFSQHKADLISLEREDDKAVLEAGPPAA